MKVILIRIFNTVTLTIMLAGYYQLESAHSISTQNINQVIQIKPNNIR